MSRRSNWSAGSSTSKSGTRFANTIRLPIGWLTRLWIEEDEARFQFKVPRAPNGIQRDLETLKPCNLETLNFPLPYTRPAGLPLRRHRHPQEDGTMIGA